MVGAVHDELHAPADGAESADDEPVADEVIVVGHMLLDPLRAVRVVVIGIVPHKDVGAGDDVFDVHHLADALVGIDGVGIRAEHGGTSCCFCMLHCISFAAAAQGRRFPEKEREAALRLLLGCIGPSYNLHRFLAGGLSPACFTASIIQPQTAAGRPANHMLIRHPL